MVRSAAPLTLALLLSLAPPAVAQDAEAGQRVFNQCRACHTINEGGRNGVGPNLHGIVGRKPGSIEGFRYSRRLREKAAGGLNGTNRRCAPISPTPRRWSRPGRCPSPACATSSS